MCWLKEIDNKYAASIAHVFLLHSNVNDLATGTKTNIEYLLESPLFKSKDIVVCFNRSAGITFPLEGHREQFLNELEIAHERINASGIDEALTRDPVVALTLIEAAMRLTKVRDGQREAKTAVIIEYAETLVPDADYSQMSPPDRTVLTTIARIARDRQIADIGSPMFLITENQFDIHSSLRMPSSRIESIAIPLPELEERSRFIEAQVSINDSAFGGNSLEGLSVAEMARLTAGLKKLHLEDIFLRAGLDNIPVTVELVKERKKEIIAQEFSSVLEIIDPTLGFEQIGGLKHIKDFFRKNVILPIYEGRYRRCPMGILLPGPAGTGKTVLAEALAKESGLNCCSLNISKIMDKFVGASEANLEKALQCIETLSPTIVIIDEIDQSGLSRNGSGDSGVGNRLFKRLLEFMSDTRHRGKVVFIGLTNRPDLMDAALKRPGRIDKKAPVLPPEPDERVEIIKVMLTKYEIKAELSDNNFTEIAGMIDGYTGAEIEALVLKASEVAEDSGEGIITPEFFKQAFAAYKPTTKQIEEMTIIAIDECNDLDLLPLSYRKSVAEKRDRENKKEPEYYIRRKRKVDFQ